MLVLLHDLGWLVLWKLARKVVMPAQRATARSSEVRAHFHAQLNNMLLVDVTDTVINLHAVNSDK